MQDLYDFLDATILTQTSIEVYINIQQPGTSIIALF